MPCRPTFALSLCRASQGAASVSSECLVSWRHGAMAIKCSGVRHVTCNQAEGTSRPVLKKRKEGSSGELRVHRSHSQILRGECDSAHLDCLAEVGGRPYVPAKDCVPLLRVDEDHVALRTQGSMHMHPYVHTWRWCSRGTRWVLEGYSMGSQDGTDTAIPAGCSSCCAPYCWTNFFWATSYATTRSCTGRTQGAHGILEGPSKGTPTHTRTNTHTNPSHARSSRARTRACVCVRVFASARLCRGV